MPSPRNTTGSSSARTNRTRLNNYRASSLIMTVSLFTVFLFAAFAANDLVKDSKAWTLSAKCKFNKFVVEKNASECSSLPGKPDNATMEVKIPEIQQSEKALVLFESDKDQTCIDNDKFTEYQIAFEKDTQIECFYHNEHDYALLSIGSKQSTMRIKLTLLIAVTIVLGILVIHFIRKFILLCTYTEYYTEFYSQLYRSTHHLRSDDDDDGHNNPLNRSFHSDMSVLPLVYHDSYRHRGGKGLSVKDANLIITHCRVNSQELNELAAKENSVICAICLEDINVDVNRNNEQEQDENNNNNNNNNTHITKFSCNHYYHESCAFQWLRKGSPSCPCCFHNILDDLVELKKSSPSSFACSSASSTNMNDDSYYEDESDIYTDAQTDTDGPPSSMGSNRFLNHHHHHHHHRERRINSVTAPAPAPAPAPASTPAPATMNSTTIATGTASSNTANRDTIITISDGNNNTNENVENNDDNNVNNNNNNEQQS